MCVKIKRFVRIKLSYRSLFLSLSLSLNLTHTHTLSHSLTLTLTHTLLSLSLTHTHTLKHTLYLSFSLSLLYFTQKRYPPCFIFNLLEICLNPLSISLKSQNKIFSNKAFSRYWSLWGFKNKKQTKSNHSLFVTLLSYLLPFISLSLSLSLSLTHTHTHLLQYAYR